MRTVDEARNLLAAARARHMARTEVYGERAELYHAMQTILGWDTIYEPKKDRVCTPVSRKWNINWGGYVLFDWDTYFAGWMASIDHPDLAIANAVEFRTSVPAMDSSQCRRRRKQYIGRPRSRPPSVPWRSAPSSTNGDRNITG
jgi:hypothetical protein